MSLPCPDGRTMQSRRHVPCRPSIADQVPVHPPHPAFDRRPALNGRTPTMTYPAYDTSHLADGFDTRHGPVTCTACGCRLQRAANGEETWFHYAPMAGRDARGCRVDCVDEPHNVRGRALVPA